MARTIVRPRGIRHPAPAPPCPRLPVPVRQTGATHGQAVRGEERIRLPPARSRGTVYLGESVWPIPYVPGTSIEPWKSISSRTGGLKRGPPQWWKRAGPVFFSGPYRLIEPHPVLCYHINMTISSCTESVVKKHPIEATEPYGEISLRIGGGLYSGGHDPLHVPPRRRRHAASYRQGFPQRLFEGKPGVRRLPPVALGTPGKGDTGPRLLSFPAG